MLSVQASKPFIAPVFIPHAGCSHRCIFCDQTRTTGQRRALPSKGEVEAAIRRFLSYRKDPGQWTEISFYGGNFLGLPNAQIIEYLEIANGYITQNLADGIRFSTRPDTINPNSLARINAYPISTIELGVQSMNDSVLAKSRRGHSAEATRAAMALLKQAHWRIGLQMMVGLPGDTTNQALESGRQIASLRPDFVRIYPCLVLEGSPLAHWYAQGKYAPLSIPAAVEQVKALYALFTQAHIPVIRMGLQPTDQLNAQSGIVAGPFHPAFGELVHSALWLSALQKRVAQLDLKAKSLEIRMHRSLASRINGHKRANIHTLQSQFHLKHIKTLTDNTLPQNCAMVNDQPLAVI